MYINSYDVEMAARMRSEDAQRAARRRELVAAAVGEHTRRQWVTSVRRWVARQGTGRLRQVLRLSFGLLLVFGLTYGMAPAQASAEIHIYPVAPRKVFPPQGEQARVSTMALLMGAEQYHAAYGMSGRSRALLLAYDPYRAEYDSTMRK